MKQQFYTCKHCGNLMAMIHNAGVPVQCCGEKMHRLEPGTTEASGEKHIPVYTLEGTACSVRNDRHRRFHLNNENSENRRLL